MAHQDFKKYPNECWRYEYPDGGGPWFYPNGQARNPDKVPSFEDNDSSLCGCDTIENLNKYMEERDVDITDMYLVHYCNIKVLSYNPYNGHIIFLKKE